MATKDKAKKAEEPKDEFFEEGDDSMLINMDDIEAQTFEVIPKGTYSAVIEECEFQMSQSSGKPMWNVKMTITEGEYANRKLFTFISFSEKALPGTKAQIQRFAPELLSSAFNPKKIAEDGSLIGKALRVKTTIEKYEGEDRTRVKQLLAAGAEGDGFID